jgi:hypothetical protein
MGRTLLAISLVAGSATAAFAQAPGDYSGDASGAPGNWAPPPQVVVVTPVRDVMANRWAVGLSVGTFGVAPDSAPDATSQFDIGELSLRFRATPHLELALDLGGGTERLADGTQSDIQMSQVAIALRYRFAIESDWNWWLMGGLGGAVIDSKNATSEMRDADTRGLGELGIGLEHRWDHFALQAELRGIGLGQTKAQQDGLVINGDIKGATPAPPVPPGTTTSAPSDTLSGGSLTIGASYYF